MLMSFSLMFCLKCSFRVRIISLVYKICTCIYNLFIIRYADIKRITHVDMTQKGKN